MDSLSRSRNLKLLLMVSYLKWGKSKQTPKEWWTFFGPWRNWGNSGKRQQQGKVTMALHFLLYLFLCCPAPSLSLPSRPPSPKKFEGKIFDNFLFSSNRVIKLVSSSSEFLKQEASDFVYPLVDKVEKRGRCGNPVHCLSLDSWFPPQAFLATLFWVRLAWLVTFAHVPRQKLSYLY